MAKVTELTELTTPASTDKIPLVDASDTTQSANGSTKFITRDNLLGGGSENNVAVYDANGNLSDGGHAALTPTDSSDIDFTVAGTVLTAATTGATDTLYMPGGQPVTVTRGLVQSVGTSLYDKIVALSPIAFWDQQATIGTSVVERTDRANLSGTYTNAVLHDAPPHESGITGPYFDGTAYGNIYTTALNTAFDPLEGSALVVVKLDSAQWTDSTRRVFFQIRDTNGDRFQLRKASASNTLEWVYDPGSVVTISKGSVTTTDYFAVGLTWSDSNDRMRAYYNGTQESSDQTIGTWSGSARSSTRCNIGVDAQSPTDPMIGWIAYVAVWDSELTPAQMGTLVL